MELEEIFKDRSDEQISSFAYNVGKGLEIYIMTETNNLKQRNKDLEAKILEFFTILRQSPPEDLYNTQHWLRTYVDHFNIQSHTKGHII